MNWITQYKNSLKNIHAEELVDIFFFRPPAFLIVKAFLPFPITPNHYSFLSLLSGLVASFFFLRGDDLNLRIGSLFFLLSCILDCCDGMVARLKKNGSEFGKIIDGVVDYLVNISVFTTLSFGLLKNNSAALPYVHYAILIPLAGISKIIHSLIYDHHLSEYLSYESQNKSSLEEELYRMNQHLKYNQSTLLKKLRNIFLTFYVYYLKAQSRMQNHNSSYSSKKLRQWSLIGPSMHNLILLFSLILFAPYLYIIYALIAANIWLIRMYFSQTSNRESCSRKIK